MEKEKYNAYMKQYMKGYRPKQKLKSKRITVTLTPEEYAFLWKNTGGSMAWTLKELAFVSLQKRNNYPENVAQSLKELRHILHGVGNNINQIAHYSHSLREFTEEKRLFSALEKMEFSIKKWVSFHQKKNHDH